MKRFLILLVLISNYVLAESWKDLYGCYQTIEHNGYPVLNSGSQSTKIGQGISLVFLDLNNQVVPVHQLKIFNKDGQHDYIEIFQQLGKHNLSEDVKEFQFYDILRYGYDPDRLFHVDSQVRIMTITEDVFTVIVKNIVSEARTLNADDQYLIKKISCK